MNQRLTADFVLNASPDAIVVCDQAGVICEWNSSAARLFGWQAEEAIGMTSEDLFVPAELKSQYSAMLQQQNVGQLPLDGQRAITIVTRSDQRRVVDFWVRRVMDGNDSLMISFFRDQSQRERLQEVIDDAQAANRAKSEFVANISHELRTPMNAILGMTRLSLQESIPDVVRDYLMTARDSADIMLLLINDILDFSRLEAHRLELDPAPFSVRRIVDELLPLLSVRAHEKGLELIADVHADVPALLVGDAMRIRQVLTNLIGNAIKFTERGEVVVTVAVSADRDQSRSKVATLDFCVADTGIGIRQHDLQRVFFPFTQVDSSATRTYAGTGLGLAICNELAGLMNGSLRVESRFGHGSQFFFCAQLTEASVSDMETAPLTHSSFDEAQLAQTPVLVVDDNETTCRILKEMLESWSMQPVTAGSAKDALRALEAATESGSSFPLLIVDAVMPGMDGVDLLATIQRSAESSGATILMMSPADQKLFAERLEDLEINATLPKPISQSGLLDAICDAFGGGRLLSSPEEKIEPTSSPLRVLVAEDIVANQKVVEAILAKRGHYTTIAHNGREAIERQQNETFDVILMDVQMPIMDGLQAVRAIRESEVNGRRIPIIAMTAHAMRGDREACMKAGMDAYVSKPLDLIALLSTMESLCSKAKADHAGFNSLLTRSGLWRLRQRARETSDKAREVTSPLYVNIAQAAPSMQPINTSQNSLTAVETWQPNVALRRMGGDAELLNNMIGYFTEDSVPLLNQLENAINQQHGEEATRLAHSLKGLCGNFEADAAVKVATKVEAACRQGNLTEAHVLLPHLTSERDRLAVALALWQAEQK